MSSTLPLILDAEKLLDKVMFYKSNITLLLIIV